MTAAPAAPTTTDDPTIWRVDDALWAELQPLLVVDKPRKKPGRRRANDRPIFDGLIWLARTGGQWAALPREFGAKSTVHDRLLAAGTPKKVALTACMHKLLLILNALLRQRVRWQTPAQPV